MDLNAEGNSKSTRDFLYVDDAVRASYSVIQLADKWETYNVSQGHEINIKNLHQTIAKIAGFEKQINWKEQHIDAKEKSFLDISRIKKDLGWTPITNMEKGLAETIKWHDENLSIGVVNPDSILVR